uniref:Uncharacterized protein n=1 Tax=Chenopodium quinoa TaxID=63459 RepID=A0A803MKJ0_CHEQI
MVSAASATSELSDGFRGQEQHQVLPLSNIMLQEIATKQIGCIPSGQYCNNNQDCCWGNICAFHPFTQYIKLCAWCPTAGYPCGMLVACCSGYTCDGTFSGTCC